MILIVETDTRTALHHSLHEFYHHVGRALADGLVAVGGEAVEHGAFLVFDAGDEDRLDIFAFVGKGGHGACHLIDGNLGSTHTDGGDGVNLAGHAHLAGNGYHLLGGALFHQVGRHPVDGVRQGPFEGDHLVLALVRGVLGAPVRLAPHLEADLRVGHLGAGVHAQVLQRHGIDKGFERRTHLAVAHDVVVFEVAVVDAAHVGLDIARTGFYGHHAHVEELLVVEQRVPGRHGGVDIAFPREDAHLDFLLKDLAALLLALALHLVQLVVAVAALHGLHQYLLLLLGADVAEGVATAGFQLAVELGLHLLAHVLAHGGLGIALHARVDGGVDTQTVLVHVVVLAVAVAVVLAPVFHIGAYVFAQIGGQAVVVALGAVVRHVDFLLLEFLIVLVAEVVVAVHLRQHGVAAVESGLGVQHRAVGCGSFQQTHQHGGLVDCEVGGRLVKESLGGGLDAKGVAAEVNGVEVHGNNLLLGVVVLQLHGHHPLLELRKHRAYSALMFAGKEVLGQLLRDGTAAAAAAVASDKGLEEDTEQAARVDAGVFVETHILGGDKGIDQIGRQLVVGDIGAVLYADKAQYLAVGGDNLGGLVALGVLQLLEGGHESQPSQRQQDKEQEYKGPHPCEYLPGSADGVAVVLVFFLCHSFSVFRSCLNLIDKFYYGHGRADFSPFRWSNGGPL